ncbi:endocuticle structural glycoprotein SgAbd-2-like [Ischnura elegans]|uniref:endocuticle structural glycoprotein SgAbd-2-like n=1 Tax=Ischnura elegans TaxID=197161 RepID=UPI001ED88DC6|nr:endocuticle structural glycoprotein SgAbd-2-like [Ischnura elegans]
MKMLASTLLLLLPVVLAAPQVRQYRPPVRQHQPGEHIAILSYVSDGPNPDGSYSYSYQTENGISAAEAGQLKNPGTVDEAMVAQGSYSYTAPDGTPIELRYIADENGFRAEGAHLPVGPPIPPAIQRALDYLATLPVTTQRPF